MQLPTREIHLDFHTSELIPDIASQFDAGEFASTAKEAHVNSMTVFARCHHGWLYYDSKKFPELVHPNLKNKNLLVEEVHALHKEHIKAPVYITVQWDYYSATHHPEWLIRKPGGAHEGDSFMKPGFYQSLCVNTGYKHFLEEITKEVLELLGDEVDGIFYDIVGVRPCYCAACRKEMKERKIDVSNETEVRSFAGFTMNRFKKDMTALIRTYNDKCTIFYNAGHVGPCTKESVPSYTHFELESLPSGSWGYQHFPVTARYARTLGKDCMGMTGKFHTAWGDFHSLKNRAALEFECFRMLSFGFACSIGDQLPPQGSLNPATYQLIGSVYKMIEEREEYARPSKAVVEAALVTSENPLYEHKIPEDIFGASEVLEELSLQFDIIDTTMELSGYPLIILPDSLIVTKDFQEKLENYVADGGNVIACGRGGLNDEGEFPKCFGVTYEGEQENTPDFIVAEGKLCDGLEEDNEYVIYQQGFVTKAESKDTTPVLFAKAPFFPRKGDEFCSHLYTPSAEKESYPVGYQKKTKKGSVLYFSHPFFGQYRANAPLWCKTIIGNAVNIMLPKRLITHDGPSTVTMQLREQPEQNRYTLHMLSYIPVRKSAEMDIIEERTTVYGVGCKLNLPVEIKSARIVPDNIPLEINDHALVIPKCDGYAIVELNV